MAKHGKKRFPVPPAIEPKKSSGLLPPTPGTVLGHVPRAEVTGSELTAAELEIVKQSAWTPGEPLPVHEPAAHAMAPAVAEVLQDAKDFQGMSPIDPSTPPLEPPEPVDIASMPPKEREEAEKVFSEMDNLQDRMNAARKTRMEKQPPAHVMRNPGAAQAFAVAEKAQRDSEDAEVAVTAAKQDEVATEEPPHREMQGPFKLKPEEGAVEPKPAPETKPEVSSPEQDEEQPEVGGDLTGTTTYCPRCNFDLNTDPSEPTTVEVAGFLKAVLDGGRFYKQIKLFAGRIVIVFRTLSPKEVDAALIEADKELAAGNISHIMQYARVAEGYKLAAGIESVTRSNDTTTFPELNKIEQAGDDSPIKEMYDYFNNDVFTTESLRRAIGHQWARFNNLVQHMEAKADDPDFFESGG